MDKKLSLLCMLLLMSSSVAAEIYKWVDDTGKVHYGDKPKANSEQLDIAVESEPSKALSQQQREERRKRLIDAFDEDRAEKNEQLEKDRKKKAKLERNCANARDRLRRYSRASSLYDLDKEGNRITLSNEERERSTQKLQKRINKYCN